MILSEEYTRLCESLAKPNGFNIYLHDSGGELIETIPKLDEEYIDAYHDSGMYRKITDAFDEDGHPVAMAGPITDIWTGYPINGGYHMIVGPIFYADFSERALDNIKGAAGINAYTVLKKHLYELPVMAYEKFAGVIAILYYVLTGNSFDHMKFGVGIHPLSKQMARQVSIEQRKIQMGESTIHASYSFERYMLECITEGNEAKLYRHLSSGLAGEPGRLSAHSDQLRQQKNIFIVSATLITRAAIKGGLNPEIAMSMSDLFIQQAERMNTIDGIMALSAEMPFEFIRRVNDLLAGGMYSKNVEEICRYISENIYKTIRIPDIASYVNLTPNYISTIFKEETGSTIIEYIKKMKINEAKSLLRHSVYTLKEISTLLNFPSQSLFSEYFKNETGYTPKQYRETSDKPHV